MPEDACEAYVQSTVRHLRLLCKSNARQSAASHEHTAMSIIYGKKTCTSSRARCGVVREIQDSCVGVFHRDSPALHVRNAECHIFVFILGSALLEEREISQSDPHETNRMGEANTHVSIWTAGNGDNSKNMHPERRTPQSTTYLVDNRLRQDLSHFVSSRVKSIR